MGKADNMRDGELNTFSAVEIRNYSDLEASFLKSASILKREYLNQLSTYRVTDLPEFIKNIDITEYKQLLEANECLDSKLGEISAKTYASDTSYSYLFMLNDEYYHITVNYTNNYEMNEQITNEVNKILKTIEIKKKSTK